MRDQQLQVLQVHGLQRQPPLAHPQFRSASTFWRSFISSLLFDVAPFERIAI
jgi:hypothetical protein